MKMSGGRLFQAGLPAFPKVGVCLGDRGIDSVTGAEWIRRRGQNCGDGNRLQCGLLVSVRTLASTLRKIGNHCGCWVVE